jgi:hypothetical protein
MARSKQSPKILFLFLFFIYSLAIRSSFADNNSAAPFTVGTGCSETTTYSWKIETKTAWAAQGLLAVPDGYLPFEWEGTNAFVDSMKQRLSGNTQISAMSQALLSQWQESIVGSAMIYVMYARSITTEDRNVQCIEGTWQINVASDHTSAATDSTQWVSVTEDPAGPGSLSAEDLAQKLATLLATVNSQPGADTAPFNSYTKISD